MAHAGLNIHSLERLKAGAGWSLTTDSWQLTTGQWGMLCFLVSEASLFCTLIVVYLTFLGADQTGPTPAVLSLPLVIGTTLCLLSSSVTVHRAVKASESGS